MPLWGQVAGLSAEVGASTPQAWARESLVGWKKVMGGHLGAGCNFDKVFLGVILGLHYL